jgi:signal transduction histidine kinase
VTLRAKLLATVVPALALALAACVYAYSRGASAVEELLRAETEVRTSRIAGQVGDSLRAYDAHLARLAGNESLRGFAAEGRAGEPSQDVRAALGAFMASGRLVSVTCVARGGGPLFIARRGVGGAAEFQTKDFIMSALRTDERAWRLQKVEALRSHVTQEQYGNGLRATAPVFAPGVADAPPAGALVFEINLTGLFEDAEGAAGAGLAAEQRTQDRAVVAVDAESGRVVYHTNEALRSQPAADVMPYFEGVRAAMSGGEAGHEFFDAPGGDRWLAAYRRVDGLSVYASAAADYTRATAPVRDAGRLAVAATLVAGLLAALLVLLITTRAARRIQRVSQAASAIARGDLEQHLEVEATGQTRALIESFNLMSERLREHITREAETRQFESFMRLSAMLTHDLKNAITGLSMLVANMERERLYDSQEFRADAVVSLRDATDKLRRIVARLNEPVKSLSGEYRRDARQTDLVPVINRVLAMNAFPSAPLYEIDARLPATLVATVEPERIENVVENLVINALEAMGARGGRLTVEAGEEGDRLVYFSVADTGPGMSEEFIRARLFRPFATTKTKGIGLGLFTCREIVEAHGGRLDVESRPGVGTRFRVVLPSAPFTSAESRRRPEKRTAAAAATVTSGEHGA